MGNEQSSSASRSPQPSRAKNYAPAPQCGIVNILKRPKKDRHRELINALVYSDASVNAVGELGMTALHLGVLSADEFTIKALVAFGANCNAKNDFNQTPLDIAVENRKDDLIPLLMSVGCQSGSVTPPIPVGLYSSNSAPPSPEMGSPLDDPNPVTDGLKRAKSILADQVEEYLKSCLESSCSIRPEEAYPHILQQRELQKYKEANGERSCSPFGDATPPPLEFSTKGGARILSLDGGGMRGLIQLEILFEIEQLTGKPIVKLFDWIIGNSIGGIMALGLVYADMSLNQLRRLYFRIKDEVFSTKRPGFGYNTKALETILQKEFGTELRMCDRTYPRVLITAVDKSNIPMNIHYFNNCFNDQFSTQPVWKVARYTSAAPLYFTELDNYVDGGVMANNPCDGGLAMIQSYHQSHNVPVACMVSVGSGQFPAEQMGAVSIFKLSNLFRLLSDALGQSEEIADRCRIRCEGQKIPFYRLSPQLDKKMEPTETDTHKLLEIMIAARIYMNVEDYKLDRLLPLLLKTTNISPKT